MKYIGAHVSVKGGVQNAPMAAAEIGAKAFAIFTGFSNRWMSKDISPKVAQLFRENCEKYGFTPDMVLPHDNFLINLGNPDREKYEKSVASFTAEMHRCEQLGLKMLNFHPGSHLNQISEDECLDKIADTLNRVLEKSTGVTAVLESTAGQGSNMGYRFEHLAHIINKIEDKSRIGVCVDTCHTHSAGYDLASPEGYARTWAEFDEIIGSKYLKALHLNDNKRTLGSRIDRHEEIGLGTLGKEFFIRLVNDPRFDNMPLILETPNEENWKNEIAWLYSQIKNPVT
ncbi:MAG: deoxyribonuclease IV [Candidatus Amulumruptor caecigallinarius]|nr:deoxyribonuclease IV [Candidatus Amulumruptor caecigallinarius]